jgi:hypothetical protein
MHFYWRSLFFVAFNNTIHESIHISIDHRVWVLFNPSLCWIWILSMEETKILNSILYHLLTFRIANNNRW